MAVKISNTPVINDSRELVNIAGYDSGFVTTLNSMITAKNHTFVIYNDAGTAIKTLYLIPE